MWMDLLEGDHGEENMFQKSHFHVLAQRQPYRIMLQWHVLYLELSTIFLTAQLRSFLLEGTSSQQKQNFKNTLPVVIYWVNCNFKKAFSGVIYRKHKIEIFKNEPPVVNYRRCYWGQFCNFRGPKEIWGGPKKKPSMKIMKNKLSLYIGKKSCHNQFWLADEK